MNELAQGARRVLNCMENNGIGEVYIINFIKSVERFAVNAPAGGNTQQGNNTLIIDKVQQALDRIDNRMEIIKKATSSQPSTQSNHSSNDPAAF